MSMERGTFRPEDLAHPEPDPFSTAADLHDIIQRGLTPTWLGAEDNSEVRRWAFEQAQRTVGQTGDAALLVKEATKILLFVLALRVKRDAA